MSPVYLASAVVAVSCIAFMAVGTAYKWDLTSEGYGRWTRTIGALSLIGVVATAVWDRLKEPRVAVAATVVSVTLSAGFVWAHRLLSCRLLAAQGGDTRDRGCDSPEKRP